jgi:hypothetical protein
MKYLPLTVRRSIELLGLCALGLIIVLGQNVIMPLLMAFFIAMLFLCSAGLENIKYRKLLPLFCASSCFSW